MQKSRKLLMAVGIFFLLFSYGCTKSVTRPDNSNRYADSDYSSQKNDSFEDNEFALPNLENCNQYLTEDEIIAACGVTDSVEIYGFEGGGLDGCQFKTIADSKGKQEYLSFTLREYSKHREKGFKSKIEQETIYKGIKMLVTSIEPSELRHFYTRGAIMEKENYFWNVGSIDMCTMEQLEGLAALIYNRS
ncbi:hypothetical protein HYW82_00010 [Candidatus Peregrinibacteria bacterium]|nr:hypothetical protein [Candidatus Peregrinibacteria bacterium]